MKTLTITLTQQQYDLACRRLLDPQEHLQNFAQCMVHNSMQELGYQPLPDGSYDPEHIKAALARPSAKQVQEQHKADAEKATREAELLAADKSKQDAVLANQQAQEQDALNKAADEQMQAAVEARAKELAFAMMQTLAAEKIVKTNDLISSNFK
jgi:hypothetical protein